MKYDSLYKLYYSDRDKYNEAFDQRLNDKDTVRLGIDIAGNEAFYMPCCEMFELVSKILRIDKKVTLIKRKVPEYGVEQFKIENLIVEIYSTNKIEGVNSTRKEIDDALKELKKSKRKDKRFIELINHYNMLGDTDINMTSCNDIRKLYDQLVLNEVLEHDPENMPDGSIFRKQSVSVVSPTQNAIHRGVMPEEKIIEYMDKALSLLNDEKHDILIRTAVFHYLFGYIHPFYDGNGRLSRFISSYYLSRDLDSLIGNRLSYTIQMNNSKYNKIFRVCNDSKNKGDITPFIIIFLEIILEAEENLLAALDKRRSRYEDNISLLEKMKKTKNWDQITFYLSHVLLINTLFSKIGLSREDLRIIMDVKSKGTIKNKLDILDEYDLLDKYNEGRTIYYRLRYESLKNIRNGQA